MKGSIAEDVFMAELLKSPSIQKNGIVHSDEYYEMMINDSNIPNGEKVEILLGVRQATKNKIEELDKEHLELAHEIAIYENDKSLLRRLMSRKQQEYFRYRIIRSSCIFFIFLMIIVVTIFAAAAIDADYLLIVMTIAAILASVLLAIKFTDKARIYAEIEVMFLEDLEMQKKDLDQKQADILSLQRLKTWVDDTLKINNVKWIVEDLKKAH